MNLYTPRTSNTHEATTEMGSILPMNGGAPIFERYCKILHSCVIAVAQLVEAHLLDHTSTENILSIVLD